MRLSPAIQPDATGKVNSSDHCGYFFVAHQASEEEEQPIIPVKGPGQAHTGR